MERRKEPGRRGEVTCRGVKCTVGQEQRGEERGNRVGGREGGGKGKKEKGEGQRQMGKRKKEVCKKGERETNSQNIEEDRN